MANPEHLEILKQGVEVWNKWRLENPGIMPDLSEANLREADLREANLRKANLIEADLIYADLRDANLREANLSRAELNEAYLFGADLSGANLVRAEINEANLNRAYLSRAYLSKANLIYADLRDADLRDANLAGANLAGADLARANLSDCNFENVFFGFTVLANVDLSATDGLERIRHHAPSHLSTETIQRAQGKLPEVFLRGCGLSEFDIEYTKLYNPDLSNQEIDEILYRMHDLRAHQSLQISPLFISYSHADSKFVEKVEGQLNDKGIRFWRDVHHATAGRLEKQIDRAIQHNPTVLLILSENSTNSDWVEHEVRTARKLEKELGRDVLCPVALDDSWKNPAWPQRVMEQVMEYNIVDFSKWEDDNEFEKQFKKLIDGLDIFYK